MGSEAKKIKREFVLKSLWDREGIEKFLEKKASAGWMLESIQDIIWLFRKEEPKNLHFSVVYFPKASSYDPKPSEKLLMFQDLCEHTGWKLAAGDGQTQIYYNEADDATPIETEEEMAVQAIHESAKRYYLPVCCFLIVLGLIQFGLFCYRLATNTLYILSNNAAILSGIFALLVLALPVISIVQYRRWHQRVEEMIEAGEDTWTRNGPPDLRLSIIGMMFIALAFMIISLVGGISGILFLAMAAVGILGITIVVIELSKFMKKKMVSGKTNRNLTYTAAIVGALLVAGGLMLVMFRRVQEPGEFNAFAEEDTAASVLCSVYRAQKITGIDGLEDVEVSCRIVDVKLPFLFGLCESVMEKEFAHGYGNRSEGLEERLLPTETAPWGADKAYQLCISGWMRNRYLLCYGHKIVEVDFGFAPDLTEQQKQSVGEHFGK